MAASLLLGPVTFQDFELPAQIAWGGSQRLKVHALPGGARVIDAMGRDDAPIAWSGAFSGEDAAMRARLLDLMRAEGGVWPLTWGSFFYSVVVQSFSVQYERATWMPYRIVCTVLRDELEGLVDAALSLAQDVAGDLGQAASFGGLDISSATTALGGTDADRLGSAAYTAAFAAVASVASSAQSAFAGADAEVGTASLASAAGLQSAAAATAAQAQAGFARAYANRAAVNLANASS